MLDINSVQFVAAKGKKTLQQQQPGQIDQTSGVKKRAKGMTSNHLHFSLWELVTGLQSRLNA